jgi:hypothetical protein
MALQVKLESKQVKQKLKEYFDAEDISSTNEYNVFDHITDDKNERDFKIDFVTAPFARKGCRDDQMRLQDEFNFKESSKKLDDIVRRLKPYSLFPGKKIPSANAGSSSTIPIQWWVSRLKLRTPYPNTFLAAWSLRPWPVGGG